MTKISLTYCGMPGEGATVREAKADAARKIESTLAANYTPAIFNWKGRIGIVWQTPTGIRSSYYHEDGRPHGCTISGSDDWEQVCRSMRYNLAQNGADIESDEVPAIIKAEKDCILRDYRNWIGFQRAYRAAKNDRPGDGDTAWHRFACENERTFAPAALTAA